MREIGRHAAFAVCKPVGAAQCDGLVCRAGFRNFGRPIEALPEMRRVVRPGVGALVIEQRKDATDAEIDPCVDARGQGWLTATPIRRTLNRMLRRRLLPTSFATRRPRRGSPIVE